MVDAGVQTTTLRISVIVPTFNAGPFIAETLNSIKKQDHPAAEVILVDGGSDDGTVEAALGVGLASLRLIVEPDRGQLDALEKGCRAATGDILVWINGDDIVMPGAFRAVVRAMAAEPLEDYVYSDDFAFDAEKSEIYAGATIKGLSVADHSLFYRQFYSECVYWRRQCTRYLGEDWYDLRICTDYAFFLNLRDGRRGRWLPKRLGAFRIRSGQASEQYRERHAREFQRIRDAFFAKRGLGPAKVRAYRAAYWPYFFVRQVARPHLIRAIRRVCRLIDKDRSRRALADFFFSTWLRSGSQRRSRAT